MTRGNKTLFARRHLPAAFALLLAASSAGAQSLSAPDQPAAAAQAGTLSPAQMEAPYWAPIGGFEGDTHGTGYGFFGPSYVHPIKPNVAVTGQIFGNYLYYQFQNGSGMTKVTSPGASTKAGLRFGGHNWFQVGAGPSFKRRHISTSMADGSVVTTNDMKVGLSVGTSLYVNPTTHSNVQGIFDYGTEDKYKWGRLGYKEQISNHNWQGKMAHFVGAEYIGQGNFDITSQQFGGFVEFTHVPSTVSVMLRTGYKRSTFNVGPDKNGPYFAIGFYQRLK